MAVVYLHKRNDTNEIFYVGIGADKKRAFYKAKRNQHWKNIVEKYGYTVDILVSDTPWEDACKIEKLLIEKYGRKDLGFGNLVNMTDGGQGTLGKKSFLGRSHTKETKQKMSEASKGKTHSEKTRQKISEKKKGTHMSEETKQKVSLFNRNKEGVKGYSFHKKSNKYQAYIKVGGKSIHIGLYNTPEEARDAYINAKKIYHTYE